MPFQDPMGSQGNTMVDKLDRMEKMPLLEQRAFDEGLVNYMVRNQYTHKKVEFIRKTYCVLMFYLLVSCLISIPFINQQQGMVTYFSNHSWVLWLAGVVLFLQTAFYFVVMAFLATGQNKALLVYIKLQNAFLVNYVWALLYTASFTIIVDAVLAAFGFANLCYVYLYSLCTVAGLIFYTYAARNPDFQQLYGYVVPVVTAVVICFALHLFADAQNSSMEHCGALLLSIMFGWIVVFDTQLIFGAKVERGRKYPYQMQMYAMAAYEMYFDLFIHFYFGAFHLFPAGEHDDPLTAKP